MIYRDWIRRGLAQPGKSGKGLARALGVTDGVVSRMVHGKRPIKADELPIIAEYLELPIPSSHDAAIAPKIDPAPDTNRVRRKLNSDTPEVRLVPVKAKLARGVWREDRGNALLSMASVPAVVDPRLNGIDQYACEFEDVPGRFGIFVPYSSYRVRPIKGDTVHVRRTRDILHEDTLRIVEIEHGGRVKLIAVDDPNDVVMHPSEDPDETVTIRGLMVGRYEMLSF